MSVKNHSVNEAILRSTNYYIQVKSRSPVNTVVVGLDASTYFVIMNESTPERSLASVTPVIRCSGAGMFYQITCGTHTSFALQDLEASPVLERPRTSVMCVRRSSVGQVLSRHIRKLMVMSGRTSVTSVPRFLRFTVIYGITSDRIPKQNHLSVTYVDSTWNEEEIWRGICSRNMIQRKLNCVWKQVNNL